MIISRNCKVFNTTSEKYIGNDGRLCCCERRAARDFKEVLKKRKKPAEWRAKTRCVQGYSRGARKFPRLPSARKRPPLCAGKPNPIRAQAHEAGFAGTPAKEKSPPNGELFSLAGVQGFEPRKCQSQSLMPYRLATPQYFQHSVLYHNESALSRPILNFFEKNIQYF